MSDGEIIDVVDDEGNVVKTISREEAERDNHTIENVIIFIFNPSGEVWIQKRPMTKAQYPGLWDPSTCGAIITGEDKLAAAKREQLEEMGFSSDLKYVETFMNEFPDETKTFTRRRLSHLFVGVSDQVPKPNQEVDEFQAVPYDELRGRIAQHPTQYVPSLQVELEKAVKGYESLT